ncbi:helix-turn-helix domain-containing protein [Leucobacter celer]|uniref:helix-turn-helix domain-containing protein n=1 Tax=Leucobacter celer TaxID=668625 RepID=UPI0006A77F05|nr:helix-turn-helix transcriptional regulator [Leucobacter celer]
MSPADPEEGHAIRCRLDELLAERGMTLTELSDRVGVSLVNLSVLKNNRARAVRFSTLTAICRALDCEVGELFVADLAAERA